MSDEPDATPAAMVAAMVAGAGGSVEPAAPAGAYGVPGVLISRTAPFYRGFFWTFGALLAVLLAYAVTEAADTLVLVLVATFLAVGLDPIVGWLGRRGVPRGAAVLLVTVVLLGVLTLIVWVLGTLLRNQVVDLIDNAPRLLEELRRNRTVAKLDSEFDIFGQIEKKLNDPALATEAVGDAFGFGIGVFNAIANTVIVMVLTVYFLAALPRIKAGLYRLVPASRRERVTGLSEEILLRVGRYATGAVVVALLAGTVTAIFSVIVGVGEFALPLAVLVALLDLVPLVGAILGAATVCVVGFATSLPIGIACVVFYVIYELIEGYVIYPRVMRSSVDVPEYVTVVAVLLGGAVGGIVGALMALPVAAAMILLAREVWVRRQDVS